MADSAVRTWDHLCHCQEKVAGEDGQKGYLPLAGLMHSLRRWMCLEVWPGNVFFWAGSPWVNTGIVGRSAWLHVYSVPSLAKLVFLGNDFQLLAIGKSNILPLPIASRAEFPQLVIKLLITFAVKRCRDKLSRSVPWVGTELVRPRRKKCQCRSPAPQDVSPGCLQGPPSAHPPVVWHWSRAACRH